MKNGIKKAVALGLTGVMMLLAAGCGKSEKVNADNRKEFYYVPSYQDFPIEVDYISNIAATGDDIYLYGTSWNEETEESSGSMYHYQISEGKLQEMPVDLSENSSIQQMKINQAGNLFLIVNTYEKVSTDAETEDSDTSEESPDTSEESTNTLEESTDASEEATEREEGDVEASKKAALEGDGAAETEDEIEYRNQMEMWEISPEDGSLLNVVDLKSAIEDAGDFWVQQMALDSQGNIYLSDGSTAIYVLDASGNRLFSIAVDNWVENLFSAGDGTVYMKTWGSTGLQVKPVDLNAF